MAALAPASANLWLPRVDREAIRSKDHCFLCLMTCETAGCGCSRPGRHAHVDIGMWCVCVLRVVCCLFWLSTRGWWLPGLLDEIMVGMDAHLF